MILEGRGWHNRCRPEQIKGDMIRNKFYLHGMFTTIFVEFETLEELREFRALMDKTEPYWDYDPVATLDTSKEDVCERWKEHMRD